MMYPIKIRIFAVLASLMVGACSVGAQTRVSILGDSYSTYGGYVSPETNWCWYNGSDGGLDKQNDVDAVEQTWWYKFIQTNGLQLERNNSFSGSTVCCTGYGAADYSDRAFITRVMNLGNPDVIIVFGGTNDSWAHAPVGEYKFGDWTKADLCAFRPAFAQMLNSLKTLYPLARIINVTNSELSDDITQSMADICRFYGVENLLLTDIDKQWGHPSIKGMQAICDQLTQLYQSAQ